MDKEKIREEDMIVPYFEDTGKRRPVLRAVITVLVLLIIAGSVFYALNRNVVNEFMRRTFSSPKDYFTSVEKRDLSAKTGALVRNVSAVGSALNDEGGQGSLEARITANETAISLASAALGTDLSSLGSAGIRCSAVRERDELLVNAALFLNDVRLGGGDASLSLRTKELLFFSDDVSDFPASVDLSDKLTLIGPALPVAASLAGRLDPDTVDGLVGKYVDTVLSEFGSFTKKSGKLEAAGVAQRCAVLTAGATRSESYRALASLLRRIKNDGATTEIIRSFLEEYTMEYSLTAARDEVAIDAEKLYDVLIGRIDEYIAYAENEAEKYAGDDGIVLKLTDYVNGHGEIIGRELWYDGKTVISVGFAEHRTDFGFEARYGGALLADGAGKTRDGSLSGRFRILGADGGVILTADVTDLDREGLRNGSLNGEFLLSPTEKFYAALPFDTTSLPSLITNNVSLKIGVYTDSDNVRAEIAPLLGGADFIKIAANISRTARETPRRIDGDGAVKIMSFEDLAEWFGDRDPDLLAGKLTEAGLPEELVDLITQTIGW
ncbi:MAG: hypothetical protein IKI91_00695 [Clostridia bacterium]|nr:hypothetical protein [Clostridia bacterium]